MIRKSVRAVAVLTCLLAVLGMAGAAAAVDAPKWVAAMFVEQQKMVGLRWMPVPGATGYKVFRTVTAGKDQQEIATTTAPQHLDSSVEAGTTYYYSLKAVAGAELSGSSDEKTVVIPGAKKSGVEVPELDSVTLQTSVEFGKPVYKVGVLWRGKGAAAVAFNLYRSLESGKQGEMVASSQEQRYIDVAVEPGKTYFYSVTALDESFQETKPSAEKSVEVKVAEVAAAAPKKVKKEYPKLIPIPTRKGETMKLPGDPFDAVMDSSGRIYVAAGRLLQIDGIGGNIKDITPEGVSSVTNVGLGLDEELLATVTNSQRVLIIEGAKIREFVVPPQEKPLKNYRNVDLPLLPPRPLDVIQNVDGKFWVTDNTNNRVAIFGDDLKFEKNAALDTPEEVVANATSMAHDSKGNVFVASGSGNYVNIYDKEGTLIGNFGETGNIAGSFGRIGGIFVDAKDNVWIADMLNASVQKFDTTGKFLGAISAPDGKGGLGLATPGIIALDAKVKDGFVIQGIDKSLAQVTILE